MHSSRFVKVVLVLGLCTALFFAVSVWNLKGTQTDQVLEYIESVERDIPMGESLWLPELTWLEIRDRIREGYQTVIIPAGGIEQNGPFVVTGKHDYIVAHAAEDIAKTLGNTLIAPVVSFVPQGNLESPDGHLLYPGTIGVSEVTFQALVSDIVISLRLAGFQNVVLLGDSGGNQSGLSQVATSLDSDDFRVIHALDYYEKDRWSRVELAKLGIEQNFEVSAESVPIHSDYFYESMLMVIDPEHVRFQSRLQAELDNVNDIPLSPAHETIRNGEHLFKHRVDIAVAEIRAKLKL